MGSLAFNVAGGRSGGGQAATARGSGLARSVMELLERTEYRRCESAEDLEAIYRLRYRSYFAHGFVGRSARQMVKDELDDTPNAYRFAIHIDNRLVSTVRIHHIDRQNPYGPVMKAFGDVMTPLIEQGHSCINPSMLAADPEVMREYRVLPYVSLRLVVVAYAYFASTYCACLIRREHTAFYSRVFGAREMSPPRPYPPISVPLMLYGGECAREIGSIVGRFPFFRSTPVEQRLLFGPVKEGEPAPLTVLPTAKFLQRAA